MIEFDGNGRPKSLLELEEEARVKFNISLLNSRIKAMESVSLLFGNGSGLDLVNEDPVSDDGEAWDEIGVGGTAGIIDRHPSSLVDLTNARNIGRLLSQGNGFAIAAVEARICYIVGTGLSWRAVAKDDTVSEDSTQRINDAIKAFTKENKFVFVEPEVVQRADRDGEVFVRTFQNPRGPLKIRFVEPEDVTEPPGNPDHSSKFGVQTDPVDVQDVTGYWVVQPGETRPVLIPAYHNKGKDTEFYQIMHLKANVDMNSRRGWPTLYPARRNFSRAEKLLRNMSYVAALQAGIAMIRKHDSASKTQVESFLDANSDLLVSNDTTGRSMRHSKMLPGTVFDVGPGTTYESPISSVKADVNVAILQADLREIAAMLQMPEFMLTANAQNANLASSLVAEGPATKSFERLQRHRGDFIKEIIETGLKHDVSRGELSQEELDAHELTATFPAVISRNRLNEAQRLEIEKRNKVVSIKTWRGIAGYDNDTEEANIDQERQASMDAMPPALAQNMGQPGDPTNEPEDEGDGAPPPNPFPGKRDDDEEVGVPRKVKESWSAEMEMQEEALRRRLAIQSEFMQPAQPPVYNFNVAQPPAPNVLVEQPSITIDAPIVNVDVNVPEQEVAPITVQAPSVVVNVPEQKAPDVNVDVNVNPELRLPERKISLDRDGSG